MRQGPTSVLTSTLLLRIWLDISQMQMLSMRTVIASCKLMEAALSV